MLDVFVDVCCGSAESQLYLSKLDESKRSLGKCVLVNGAWYTPEFKSLGGKKAKGGDNFCCIWESLWVTTTCLVLLDKAPNMGMLPLMTPHCLCLFQVLQHLFKLWIMYQPQLALS